MSDNKPRTEKDTLPIGYQGLSQAMRQSGGGFLAEIPDIWRQGRTVYGGLTAGLALAAAQRTFTQSPPLRSANINFIGPVTGDALFTAALLRQGRNVTTVKVVGTCAGAVVADIVFAFGNARESIFEQGMSAPQCPAPQECEPFTPPGMAGFVPEFFNRFETRLIDGARPFSGAEDAYIRVWSRHADPASRTGTGSFLTLSDVLPPAASPVLKKIGMISSVNFLLNLVTPSAPETEDGWWQVESRLTAARGGYSTQVMRLFDSRGKLAAEGLQSVAIFV